MRYLTHASLALALAVGFAGTAHAQTVGYNVRTGDVWLDSRIGEVNDYGSRYREPFINEMTRNYGAPRTLLVDLLTRRGWAPGDVYYACAMARSLNIPCDVIVRDYERNRGQGWGALAQRHGIKPGSAAFHALKRGTVATYDRWGYPITLTDRSRVDWSKGKSGKPAKAIKTSGGAPHAVKASKSHGGNAHASHAKGHKDAGKGPSAKSGNGKSGGGNGNGNGNGGNGKGNGKGG